MNVSLRPKNSGVTLLEALVSCTIAAIVGIGVFEIMLTTATLSAKNEAIDRTHEGLRKSLDHLSHELQAAYNLPTLISTTGATVTTGPAAGLYYDRLVGEPYPLSPVLTAGSVSASATTIGLTISSGSIGSPPVPAVKDSLLIGTVSGTFRAQISGVAAAAPSGGTQSLTITLAAPFGTAISWVANQTVWAFLVHREAFIVMPNNGRNELRFYPNFEPVPTLTDITKYTVISDEVSTQTGEFTPFNVVTDTNGNNLVQADLRLLNPDYKTWMANKQNNSYNTYFRQILLLSSRLRPNSSN